MASKLYRKENLADRFEDWSYRFCKVKRQASYNYRNLFKLMSAAPKLINCKINAIYFVKNHEILLNYFNEPETKTPSSPVRVKIVFHTLEKQLPHKTLIKVRIFTVKIRMFFVLFNF